jgi:hypothetical protein
MPARKGPGRPPEIPERVELTVYVSKREQAAVQRAAQQADVSTSAWVRALVLAALTERTGRTTR